MRIGFFQFGPVFDEIRAAHRLFSFRTSNDDSWSSKERRRSWSKNIPGAGSNRGLQSKQLVNLIVRGMVLVTHEKARRDVRYRLAAAFVVLAARRVGEIAENIHQYPQRRRPSVKPDTTFEAIAADNRISERG
jgi:hypothetical protein